MKILPTRTLRQLSQAYTVIGEPSGSNAPGNTFEFILFAKSAIAQLLGV